MRIFLDKNPLFSKKFSKLKECCQKYRIGYNKRSLHTATYDTFLLAKLMEKIYEEELIKNKENTNLITYKKIYHNNNNQNSIENININKRNKVYKILNLEKEDKNKKELEIEKFIDNNNESIIEDLEMEKFISENFESIIEEFKE